MEVAAQVNKLQQLKAEDTKFYIMSLCTYFKYCCMIVIQCISLYVNRQPLSASGLSCKHLNLLHQYFSWSHCNCATFTWIQVRPIRSEHLRDVQLVPPLEQHGATSEW